MPKKDEEEPAETEVDKKADVDTEDGDSSCVEFRLGYSAKVAVFVMAIFAMLSSDVFIERVLGRAHSGFIDGRNPTASGIAVQALVLGVMTIIIAWLVAKEKL